MRALFKLYKCLQDLKNKGEGLIGIDIVLSAIEDILEDHYT